MKYHKIIWRHIHYTTQGCRLEQRPDLWIYDGGMVNTERSVRDLYWDIYC